MSFIFFKYCIKMRANQVKCVFDRIFEYFRNNAYQLFSRNLQLLIKIWLKHEEQQYSNEMKQIFFFWNTRRKRENIEEYCVPFMYNMTKWLHKTIQRIVFVLQDEKSPVFFMHDRNLVRLRICFHTCLMSWPENILKS